MGMGSLRFVTCALLLAACSPIEAERPADEAQALATAAAPVRLAWCPSVDDPSVNYELTIDSAYALRWTGPWGSGSSKLTAASIGEDPEFGPIFLLDTASTTAFSMGNLDEFGTSLGTAFCDTAPQVDTVTRDRLVAATDASMSKQRPFASCTFPAHDEAHRTSTITARPGLDGTGAVLEGSYLYRGYVLEANARRSGPNGETIYLGQGGLSVYLHPDPFAITRLVMGSGGAPTLAWDAGYPIGENTCTVVGADYVASLVPVSR
jgi:hypothetical protein